MDLLSERGPRTGFHRFRDWRYAGVLIALLSVVWAACSPTGDSAQTVATSAGISDSVFAEAPAPPPLDEALVQRGAQLYQQYCASCHQPDLTGEPDWKTPRPDGSYPAPPHDESGHTWHHSDQALLSIVRDGVDFPQSRMPVFGDLLDDQDILAIIEFLKSNWSDEAREFQWQVTWQETQRES